MENLACPLELVKITAFAIIELNHAVSEQTEHFLEGELISYIGSESNSSDLSS